MIRLQNITNEDPIIKFPKCKHVLHSECFLKLVQHEIDNHSKLFTCPLCRDVIINMPANILEPVSLEETYFIVNEESNEEATKRIKEVFYCFYVFIIFGFIFNYHLAMERNP